MHFSERYGQVRTQRAGVAKERSDSVSEEVVQCIWYDQLFDTDTLRTDTNLPLIIHSPGWWNRNEGPDFKGAEIEISGKLLNGDVEIHLNHAGWSHHGHHLDARYDNVILHVVLDAAPPRSVALTSEGKELPCLLLPHFLEEDIRDIADRLEVEHYPYQVTSTHGSCSGVMESYGSDRMARLLELSGDWRMLFKARTLRERMDRVGDEQTLYEAFLYACGYSHFKYHFRAIAEALQYDRARQLAEVNAHTLEAAYLQLAGLLPTALPEGSPAVPHFGRLQELLRGRLDGLRPLPLEWKRVGVRPNNNPERRLAGAARLIAKTSTDGMLSALDTIWNQDAKPLVRRRAFEELFAKPTGFWAKHCTWTGKTMQRPSAMIGSGRVRSIIGNVVVPFALAKARRDRDRIREERVMEFFSALPLEPENKIQKIMLPRVFGVGKKPKLNFRTQQGLLQLHMDWCEPNPACRNCQVIRYLDVGK